MEIVISREYMQTKKLFFATPCYGGQTTGVFAKCMADLSNICTQLGIQLQIYLLFNESLITRARNYAVDEFMRSDASHFIFIDADIGYDPMCVIQLMALQTPESPYDIIGAAYPKKCISWEKIKAAVDKGFADPKQDNGGKYIPGTGPNRLERFVGDYVFNPKGQQQIPISEPCEVLEIGTGFMMIKRSAFETFRDAHPELLYRPDHVRTEHFDGSRQITQYFQAEIDQIDFRKFYEADIMKLAEQDGATKEELLDIIHRAGELNSKKSNRYLSEDYWFCSDSQNLIETFSNGQKTIKELVDTKYDGLVKSVNENNKVEWKKVTGWSVRRNGKRGKPDTKKKWVKLIPQRNNNKKSNLIVTDDHKVAYFTDILNPLLEGYTESKNMQGKYSIRNPQVNENVLYSKDQLEFLYGTLLGDAYIHKNGQLLITHCEDQEDYINLKSRLFNGNYFGPLPQTGFDKDKMKYDMYSSVNEQLHYLRELLYIDGKKTVKNIIPLLTDKSLAFWYMDDGYINSHSHYIELATESFSFEDHLLIKEWFREKYDVEAKIDEKKVKYKGDYRIYNKIRFNNEDSEKLLKVISPYLIDCLSYKTNLEDVNKFDYDSLKRLDISSSFIKEVKYLSNHSSQLYDIEVEDNHNFFASGSLIHNCQKTQELGLKTWICPWMALNHTGNMTYGGSLADIAALGVSPTADVGELNKYKASKVGQGEVGGKK